MQVMLLSLTVSGSCRFSCIEASIRAVMQQALRMAVGVAKHVPSMAKQLPSQQGS
jgi:hypothetical protein